MPNWVFNYLSIEGETEEVKKFVEKAKQPYKTYYVSIFGADAGIPKESVMDSVISFWNFKQPENKQAYFGASEYKPEGYEKLSMDEKMAKTLEFKSDGWYDWNVRNWGTKWDAVNSEIQEETYKENGTAFASYRFDTAWSAPEDAYRDMVEQHPKLKFKFECEEEQGWGVVFEGINGELTLVSEWDIPSSHADYIKLGREDSCLCSHSEDPEDFFDDCLPKDSVMVS